MKHTKGKEFKITVCVHSTIFTTSTFSPRNINLSVTENTQIIQLNHFKNQGRLYRSSHFFRV